MLPSIDKRLPLRHFGKHVEIDAGSEYTPEKAKKLEKIMKRKRYKGVISIKGKDIGRFLRKDSEFEIYMHTRDPLAKKEKIYSVCDYLWLNSSKGKKSELFFMMKKIEETDEMLHLELIERLLGFMHSLTDKITTIIAIWSGGDRVRGKLGILLMVDGIILPWMTPEGTSSVGDSMKVIDLFATSKQTDKSIISTLSVSEYMSIKF